MPSVISAQYRRQLSFPAVAVPVVDPLAGVGPGTKGAAASHGVCKWRRLARTGGQTGGMDRTIVGFREDDGGTWIADLECGHSQHIRHQPPFKLAPWVLEDEGRASRIGQPLECRLCDQ